jgi:sugar/nucleoside kinase (ribokinase family)
MNNVICIGSSTKDVFFPTNEGVIMETPEDLKSQRKIAFELGAKFHVEDRFESLGGCAVNVSCGLRRLGVPSACYTVVGDDLIGGWLKKELEKEGVDTALVVEEKCLSGLSAIIVDQNSGERIIFSNQEANERMQIDADNLTGAEWISISDPNGDWKKILDTVVDAAERYDSKMSFNPRGNNIQEDARKVFELAGKMEIFFVNKDEAIEILMARNAELESQDEEYLLKELKKSGAQIVVLTDGVRGAWAYDGEKLAHDDATNTSAVDTTGAGDAFSSGFLAAYIKGKDLAECVRWGTQNGGNVVKFYGGVEGLLKESQIDN